MPDLGWGLAAAVFWLSAAALLYAYVGFPLLLGAVGLLRARAGRVRKEPVTPRVSVVIAAYNEEDVIEERLQNVLAADYPRESLEVVVASDGSTDRTVELLRAFEPDGVRVLDLPRSGKIRALDAAVREASGDVLVFTDANTHMHRGALRALAANFADPAVGGVVGNTGYELDPDGDSAGRGESLYWRYDTWLKAMESRTGSVVSAHGGLYAIRRSLYRTPADDAVTDDFIVSTGVVAAGRRLVFEPAARAWEVAVPDAGREFRRRVRLMTRGLRGVWLRRGLMNPARHGFYAVSLFSHKVLRRVLPVALAALFVSSLVVAGEHPLYTLAAAGQLGVYGLAVIGWATCRRPLGQHRFLYVPFFFVQANLAAAAALVSFLRGQRIARWEPQRHGAPVT